MRVLLVDDHPMVRAGVRSLLEDELPGVEVAEAGNGPEALERVRTADWDVVVLDLSLPGRSGLEVLKELRALRPRLPVLVMTMYAEDQYALRALRAGASGYLTKGSEPSELLQALRKVGAGGRYVSPALAEHLAVRLASEQGVPLHETLSDRELQVLRMLALGKSVKDIGVELGLSEKTISTYRTRILEKLSLATTADLIRYAIRANLVD